MRIIEIIQHLDQDLEKKSDLMKLMKLAKTRVSPAINPLTDKEYDAVVDVIFYKKSIGDVARERGVTYSVALSHYQFGLIKLKKLAAKLGLIPRFR